MKNVTIIDVAKHVGVCKKTVSRVLNNEPNVSIRTKTKIIKCFEDLGYIPNSQARGLASNQSYLIGLLYDNPNLSYVSEIQNGALTQCRSKGYNLIIFPEDHTNEAFLSHFESELRNTNLDGIILTPPFSDMSELLKLLRRKKLPFTRVGATEPFAGTSCISSNDVETSYRMCRYLISLGHTRIAFIKGHPDHNVSEQRLEGYIQALNEANIELDDEMIQQGYFTFSSAEQCARKLLSLSNRPTAIFASNDYMAAGVLKVATQKGLTIPHDLTITGFDNSPIAKHLWPSLTTVKQPVEDMSFEAAKILIQLIKDNPPENLSVTFNSELIIRESSSLAPR